MHSQSLNPGVIKTDLQRHMPWYSLMIVVSIPGILQKSLAFVSRSHSWLTSLGGGGGKRCIWHDPIYGAYTELCAGLSAEANAENNGAYSKHFSPIVSLSGHALRNAGGIPLRPVRHADQLSLTISHTLGSFRSSTARGSASCAEEGR